MKQAANQSEENLEYSTQETHTTHSMCTCHQFSQQTCTTTKKKPNMNCNLRIPLRLTPIDHPDM